MTTVKREVIGGKRIQGVDEQIAYTLTTTPWGSTPTSIAVKAYETTAMTDVTSTVLSGTASATGDVITLPLLLSLVEGQEYRIEVKFTCSGNLFEAFFYVQAER